MSKVLLIVDMSDEEYKAFTTHKGKEAIVDIGYHYDDTEGWAFFRKKLLRAKPMPEKTHNNGGSRVIDGKEWFYDSDHDEGWNDCIDEILGGKL